MGKLNRAVRLLLVAMLVFSMMVTCCGCKDTDTDDNGKDVVVSPIVEPSKEEAKETAEPVETEKPEETAEPVGTEEPAEPVEPVELTGDYLKELAQEEVWEFKLSDYNADFVAGNLITITMVIESAGEFNGTLGTCIGTAYAWEQTEFTSQAGEYTVEWKIQPSVDMAQLGLWYAESGSVGVKSVDVVIEEVEVALEGDYIKVLQMGDNWEMKLSDYNSEYKVGDYVNIEITMESDGDFNGAVGACVGKDYAWQQKEYKYDAAGTYTFSWKVKPSTDMAQIGVWWTGGTGVGITKVKVTKEEQPIGISGDFIELFTEQGYYEFSPYAVSDYIFKFGDTIKVTVELESDGAFNGCMATCVGDNYAWEQTEMSGEAGTTTWTMTVAPTADLIQIAVWWIDGTAVGIKDIKIDMVKWGYQHRNVVGDIYTSTSTDNDYTFKPSDYCDYNDGDIITIEVGLDSNDIYNGCVRMTDVNGVSRTANFESRGTAIPTLVLQANKDTEATIDFWWMNTKVAVNTIKVYKGGELPKVEPGVFEYSSTQVFPLSDYVDYKAGDTLKITATLSSDGEFNGALAASSLDAANNYWDQETFESKDGSAVTCTFILEQAQITDLQIMVWWVGGSKVIVDPKAITVEVIEAGGDTGSGDAGSGDDESGDTGSEDDDTTPPQVAGTLIFYGDANESYDSNDVSWLLNAADDDVITLVYKGESGKEGWGVLGWGASVDGNWIDSNTVKSLGYNSDSTDGSKELSVTMTAAEFKTALGITADSTVSSIKLGAWNGGQIVSLSIASEDEAGDTEGGETEGDQETTAPEVDGTLIFYGDANESYESSDVSWLMDAADDDVITLVYKGESGKNNWGVLGWGAGVDGNWVDSNTIPSLGYSSDATDGANELTVTMTAGELKDAFGITDESTVTAIKLGAWNGGQIISLSIKGEDETGDTEGGETEGDGTEGDGTEGDGTEGGETEGDGTEDDETSRIPDLCLDDTSYEFDVKTLLPDVKAGDKVLVKVSITTESTGGFKGGIGMHDANTNADGNTWKAVEYTQAGDHTLEVTILEKTGDDGNPYLSTQGQVQLWWPDATAGYDVELFVEVTAELVTTSEDDGTEGGENEGDGNEGDGTEGGETEGDGTEGDGTEDDETSRTPDLCLDDTSYEFDVKTLLPDVKAGDKVLVKVSITTESTGGFNGGIGMHDANTNVDGNTWKSAEYAQAGEHTLEVTLMEKTGDDGNPYLASQGQVQLWWPNTTAGYDVELFVEVTAELVTTSEDDGTEGGETEGGEAEDDTQITPTPIGYEAIIACNGTEFLNGNVTVSSWGNSEVIKATTHWDQTGTFDASSLSDTSYFVVTYQSDYVPKMAVNGSSSNWKEILADYAVNGVAIFSVADFISEYGALTDIFSIYVVATNNETVFSSVELVDYAGDVSGAYSSVMNQDGTECLTASITLTDWNNVEVLKATTHWDGTGTYDMSQVNANTYFLVTYQSNSAPKLAVNGNKSNWSTVEASYVSNNVALFSASSIENCYGGALDDIYSVFVLATGNDITVSSIKLVEYPTSNN